MRGQAEAGAGEQRVEHVDGAVVEHRAGGEQEHASNILTMRAPGWWMLSTTVRPRVSAMARSAPTILSADALSRPEHQHGGVAHGLDADGQAPALAAGEVLDPGIGDVGRAQGRRRARQPWRALKWSVSRTVSSGKRMSRWVT
uniref:Uncharacterized protein n=1 Tax=Triticum urartu TaxID=4572 RepID=A0A8R7QWU3_TRIUA